MTGWAIVAIPNEQDHVWKISSEKIPHMTLLFLGEQANNDKAQSIADFVEHVANTTLDRFWLNVDHRGELGPDNADVLFFKTSGYQKRKIDQLRNLRTAFLQNDDIAQALDESVQYPDWIPHLTLGYPTAPAHEDTRDYGISGVEFDRIALWTGEFEGPEFYLSDEEMELAMGDTTAEFLSHQGIELDISDEDMDEFLAHYGVPGMRWGKRRYASAVRNHQLNSASRAKDKQAQKDAVAKNNRAIDRARDRISTGKTKAVYKQAKAQYKKDKIEIGTREARKSLQKAKDKRASELAKAAELKPGKEQVTAALAKFALEVIASR